MLQSSRRLRNDLKYVEWDVKPYYTHTQAPIAGLGEGRGIEGQKEDGRDGREGAGREGKFTPPG